MTHVHYKFSSKRSYDTVVFDGPHVTVRELKRLIMGRERLRAADCDLQITNAQTKEEYSDDEGLISKGSSVIVKRIPLSGVKSGSSSKTHNTERLDVQQHHAFGVARAKDDQGSSSALPFFAKMTNLADADVSEADKLKVIMNQSTYDPSSYNKKFGATLPSNYTCYRCGNAGHHIRNCPISGEKNPEAPPRIKKSTGIPRSFMVEVDDPSIKGAMLTNCGRYAIPAIDREAYAIGKKERPPFVPQEQPKVVVKEDPIPEELLCLICHDLLSDAVVIPCCGNSYCDDCIRSTLLDSEEHICPTCGQSDVSPDTLIANKFLRQAVNNFKKERGDTKNPKRNPSAPHSLIPTPSATPAPTLPPFVQQSRALKPQQLMHKVTQQDPLLPLPSAVITLPLSKASTAPPEDTTAISTSEQPLQSAEAKVKTHNDGSAVVSSEEAGTDPMQRVAPVIHDPNKAKQADIANPQQSSSASRPCAPSACWDSSSSSSIRPIGGWTESTAQQQPPQASSSSTYSAVPPPLFPSPHFPMYLPAQQPLTTYSPGYPPSTPVWTLPSPQSAPIPSLCSSTAASPIPALMSKEWLRHQRMKRERSPHKGSSSRRSSSSRSNSGSSKAKSSRSYSRSSSRSRSRSRSRSKGRSRAHSPYARPGFQHTRSHSSRSYTYSYKRSPTPSSSSSPKVGHHSKSRSQSDHRKSRHHSKKSASGSHSSSRRRAERSPTPESGPHPGPDPGADQYLQWKQQYKEWYDKYFSSYVSHFQQLPPSPFNLPPPPPPNAQWGERSHGGRGASRDRRSPPSQSSSESRSPPSRSSSEGRSPPSHLSSDAGSSPSKGTATKDPVESKVHNESIAENSEDLFTTRKHEEGEIEEESPTSTLDIASNASQAAHPHKKYIDSSRKTYERKGKEERNSEKQRGSRRSKESDSRQDKAKTPKEAKRGDRDKRSNHKSSKSYHPSLEKKRKRECEDTEESVAVQALDAEQPKSGLSEEHIHEAPLEGEGEKQTVGDEKETEASPLQDGEIWEGGGKVKPHKKIMISINLNAKWAERTEKQDSSHADSITDNSKQETENVVIDEFHQGEEEIQAEEGKEPTTDEKPAEEEAKENRREDAFVEEKEEAFENRTVEMEEVEEVEEEKKEEVRQEENLHFWSLDSRGAEEENWTGRDEEEGGNAQEEKAERESETEGVERVKTEGDDSMMSQTSRTDRPEVGSPSMADSGGLDECEESRSEIETPVESTHTSDDTLIALQVSDSKWEKEEPEQKENEEPEEQASEELHSLPEAPTPIPTAEEAKPEYEEKPPNLVDMKTCWEKVEEKAQDVCLSPPSGSAPSDTTRSTDSGWDAGLPMESDRKRQKESETAEEKHSSLTYDLKANLPSSAPPSSSSLSSTSHNAEMRDQQDMAIENRSDRNPSETHTNVHLQTSTQGKGEEHHRLSQSSHLDTRVRDPRVGSHAWGGGLPATGAVRSDPWRATSQQPVAGAAAASSKQAERKTGKKESREQQWKRYKQDQLMKEKQRRQEAGFGENVAIQGEESEADGHERPSIHGGGRSEASNDDNRGEGKRDKKHKREDAAEPEEDELKKPTKKKREEETDMEADDMWKDEEYRKLFSVMLS